MGRAVIVAAIALIAALPSASVQAGWVGSGYSEFIDNTALPGVSDAPTADGTVSFAVWENTDGDWTNDFGAAFDTAVTGFGGVDSAANFVYFYQIVNTDLVSPESTLNRFFVDVDQQDNVTSFGRVSGFVFNDGSAVGPTTNVELGAAVSDPDREALNGLASRVETGGAATAAFSQDASGVDAVSGSRATFELPAGTQHQAIRFSFADSILAPGFSTIVFLTAHGSPTLRSARLDDGANSFNEVLSPTPLPAGVSLLFAGVLSMGGLGVCLRRRTSASQAS